MRRAVNNGQLFRDQSQQTVSRLWINVTGADGVFAQTTIGYAAWTTLGFDYGWDGPLLDDGGAVLYSNQNDFRYAIQARAAFEQTDVVPIGFRAPVAGTYALALQQFDGLFDGDQQVYLFDAQLQTLHDLKSASYSFVADSGLHTDRFEIRFTDAALGVPNHEAGVDAIAFKDDEGIRVQVRGTTIESVLIYDLQGRRLLERSEIGSAETYLPVQASTQVLLVEIRTPLGNTIKKIRF